MKFIFMLCLPIAFGAVLPNRQADVVQTSRGPLKLTPLYHGSVMLEFGGKIIHVDPWSQADYTGLPPADLILISHAHADHMDPAMIKMLRKESPMTIVLTSPAVADTLNDPQPQRPWRSGADVQSAGRSPCQFFTTRSMWSGKASSLSASDARFPNARFALSMTLAATRPNA